jgi:N-acetylmuramoyl-L-alanine amidase
METKSGCHRLSLERIENWIQEQQVARSCLYLQQHHTRHPAYSMFDGSNHFELQQAMKNSDMVQNGWATIGQHFTVFPDGSVLTGRSMERSPACIAGNNAHAICIKYLGDFDCGKDVMTAAQKEAGIRLTAALCKKFNLPVTTESIVYHHWFHLETGERNNGSGMNASCPGTNFFGGNKVVDCRNNFLPKVLERTGRYRLEETVKEAFKYAYVTSDRVNIRKRPDHVSEKSADQEPVSWGVVVGVYQYKGEWLNISRRNDSWIPGKYTREVKKVEVIRDIHFARNGPGNTFSAVGTYLQGQKLFIAEESNGWCRVVFDNKWIQKDFLQQ